MTKEGNYRLMDSSDYITTGFLNSIYVAFDMGGEIIAAGNHEKVYYKAVSRGCNIPHIIRSAGLKPKIIDEHNNLLEKTLSSKKIKKN